MGGVNNIYLSLFLLLLFLIPCSVIAQAIKGPNRVELFIEYTGEPTQPDSVYLNPATMFMHDTVLLTVVVELGSTASLSKFRVKAGKNAGGYNLAQKTFSFNGPAVLPDGAAYERVGNVVYLTLGKFYGIQQASVEVELEDSQGRKSLPVQAHFN